MANSLTALEEIVFWDLHWYRFGDACDFGV